MNKSQLKAKEYRREERKRLKEMYGDYWSLVRPQRSLFYNFGKTQSKEIRNIIIQDSPMISKTGGWS